MLLRCGLLSRRLLAVPSIGCYVKLSSKSIKASVDFVSSLIKFEDNHIIVVNKPPNLLVHSDFRNEANLADLIKLYIKQKYNKPGDVYLGVVHRIDLPCSGLLVFAKTSKAASRLTSSFVERNLTKKYIAIVQGELLGSGELHHMLETEAAAMKSVYKNRQGSSESSVKEAKLKFNALGTLSSSGASEKTSVIDVDLATGRKHQIRAQLAHIGHPIVNDVKYGYVTSSSTSRALPAAANDSFIYLHSYLLCFPHPVSKQRVTFHSEVPSDWVSGEYSQRVIDAVNRKIGKLVDHHTKEIVAAVTDAIVGNAGNNDSEKKIHDPIVKE